MFTLNNMPVSHRFVLKIIQPRAKALLDTGKKIFF